MHVPECGFWSRPFLSLAAEYVSRMSPLTLVHWVHDVTLRIASTLLSHPTPFPAFHLFRVRVCVCSCECALLLFSSLRLRVVSFSAYEFVCAVLTLRDFFFACCFLFFSFSCVHPRVCVR